MDRRRGRVRRAVALLATTLIATGCAESAGVAGKAPVKAAPSTATTAVAEGTAAPRTIDPCKLLTSGEVTALLAEPVVRRAPDGAGGATCTISGTTDRVRLRISLFGDTATAPDVYAEELSHAGSPQQLTGVGEKAFALFRDDEVGVVTLTGQAVLAVSLVSTQTRITDPHGLLTRMTPVVRQASARI